MGAYVMALRIPDGFTLLPNVDDWRRIALTLLLGVGFGSWLLAAARARGTHRGPGSRAGGQHLFFAGAIGAASEMTLISEWHGASTDLVAAAHRLRLLLVTLTIPFACRPGVCMGWT